MKSWSKRLFEALNRYKYVLLIGALGAALLLWPGRDRSSESNGGGTVSAISTAAPADLENAMEEILERMDGVGQADVLLTLQSGSELVLAQDDSLRYSGSVQAPDNYERTSEVVTNAGGSGVVVTQEKYPMYRGALVVCDGGGNDRVRLKVAEAVSALTGLGTDRIAVAERTAAAGSGT